MKQVKSRNFNIINFITGIKNYDSPIFSNYNKSYENLINYD